MTASVEQHPVPALSRLVIYRSKRRGYPLAAVISAIESTLDEVGVERGDVPALLSPTHVHLHVLTPGAAGAYQEHNVPYDPCGAAGTWSWPAI